MRGHGELPGERLEFPIQARGEGQPGVALGGQGTAERARALGLQGFEVLQGGHHAILQDLPGGGVGARQGEDIALEPVGQRLYLVGQADGGALLSAGTSQRF